MAIDQLVKIFSESGELVAEIQSLLVIKRRASDGRVLSISEEEGHRKVSVSPSLGLLRFLCVLGSDERNIKKRNNQGFADADLVSALFSHSHAPLCLTIYPLQATVPLAARAAAAASFYSPTDNMVSPTTSKLNLAKKKHHMK